MVWRTVERKTKMVSHRFAGKDLMTAIFSPRHRFRVILAHCGLVALLAGCGASTPAAVTPGPAPTIRSSSEIDLPLTAYRLTIDNLEVIQRGVAQRQVACAARYGVTTSPDPVDQAGLKAMYDESRRYGVIDRDDIEKYGYGTGTTTEKPDPSKDPAASHTKRDEVMSGQTETGAPSSLKDQDGKPLPDGGCGKVGWDEIREGIDTGDELAQKLLGDAKTMMQEHESFQQAEKDWAACMKRSGYDFKHRSETGSVVAGADLQRQREMGRLDLNCVEETNFTGQAMAVDVAIQKKLISENEASLRSALDVQKKVLARAKEALK